MPTTLAMQKGIMQLKRAVRDRRLLVEATRAFTYSVRESFHAPPHRIPNEHARAAPRKEILKRVATVEGFG